MKSISRIIAAVVGMACWATTSHGQPAVAWDRVPVRSEFISYSQRELAEAGDRTGERYFYRVVAFLADTTDSGILLRAPLEIPSAWLEREIFLHTEGGRNSHIVSINNRRAGAARDSGLPSEFNITAYLTAGFNVLGIEIPNDTDQPETGMKSKRQLLENVFIYSQPRLRIEDYYIRAVPESDSTGMISMDVVIANSYNYPETISLGYDVYSPDGKLQDYDLRDVTVEGRSRSTVHIGSRIYSASMPLWSAEEPQLYRIMFYIRDKGIITEYVPAKTGFYTTEWKGDSIYRNNRAIEVIYDTYIAADPQKTVEDIAALKESGVSVIIPDCPQPHWFYDICDQYGMYVIDQANIHSPENADDLTVGGTISNTPAWLPEYIRRIEGMWGRERNHPCIIGWSLGGASGNGYTMQKAYQWLKEKEYERPVIYRYAGGEWNTDSIAIKRVEKAATPEEEAPTSNGDIEGATAGTADGDIEGAADKADATVDGVADSSDTKSLQEPALEVGRPMAQDGARGK